MAPATSGVSRAGSGGFRRCYVPPWFIVGQCCFSGKAINQHFWVFYGALSNVEYTITVTDSETGAVKAYTSPLGEFCSVGDTEAVFVP